MQRNVTDVHDQISRPIGFEELASADLLIDAIYMGGRSGNAGDDPLGRLVAVSNSGGFRYRGTVEKTELLVLTSSFDEPDWPDAIDKETGTFVYFGDNRKPGRPLHGTPRKGNLLLDRVFADAHAGPDGRKLVPPIFVFQNMRMHRDVRFLGLVVPGTADLRPTEDLVAVWRLASGQRFQNYRARFTVLDAGSISRSWIDALIEGAPNALDLAPAAWREWVLGGRYRPLRSPRTLSHRTKSEQLPTSVSEKAILAAIYGYFSRWSVGFEYCAAALVRLMLPDVASLDVTRPSRDGGRDALGKLRIGFGPGAILADFAVEAKCYGEGQSVGVREVSRLISRLRHRQFGVLVTTSHVDVQAYKEIKEDDHPIVVVAGADIVSILRSQGVTTEASTLSWLRAEFPSPNDLPVV
ncbi:MAG: restriction endonuclease [Hyphomicrobiales bacterium]|nr:MAG: restriction endonuclease [Hyphomicrobiales bacterium]